MPTVKGSELIRFTENYLNLLVPNGTAYPYTTIYFGREISERKLKNAIESYANFDRNDKVVLLVDDTTFGSAKNGLLMTDRAVYYKLKGGNLFSSEKGAFSLGNSDYLELRGNVEEQQLWLSLAKTFSISMPKNQYVILKHYFRKLKSEDLTITFDEINEIINPEQYSDILREICTLKKDKDYIYLLAENFDRHEIIKDSCDGLIFTSNHLLFPKDNVCAKYEDIDYFEFKKAKTHTPHIHHHPVLNALAHVAAEIKDHNKYDLILYYKNRNYKKLLHSIDQSTKTNLTSCFDKNKMIYKSAEH